MKKVFVLVTALLMIIALCGCAAPAADSGEQSEAEAYYQRLISCKEQIESKVGDLTTLSSRS